jgi:pyruvate ferredoxin oxidoreductase beta subunit
MSATCSKHSHLAPGTPLCAGCGGLQALQQLYREVGERTVVVNAAGCMTLLSLYPFTPFSGSWLYTAMACAPAGAQGVRDALDIQKAKGLISAEEDLQTLVLTGDGSAYGMGLSATSAAIDRGLDFLYLCYDNEGYGNTGHQYSPATPRAAHTATSRVGGFSGFKKDLFAIWAAHRPTYVATAIAAEPKDLARKVKKAASLKGPRLLLVLAPCPTGWGFDPALTVKIGKLAVETGIWPLKEYIAGRIVHNKIPRERKPLVDYLRLQGRFAHLFKPMQDQVRLAELQQAVDDYWQEVSSNIDPAAQPNP